MDKIQAMQLFIRVAELESFSRAADSMGLPKGSVSRQIQALERGQQVGGGVGGHGGLRGAVRARG